MLILCQNSPSFHRSPLPIGSWFCLKFILSLSERPGPIGVYPAFQNWNPFPFLLMIFRNIFNIFLEINIFLISFTNIKIYRKVNCHHWNHTWCFSLHFHTELIFFNSVFVFYYLTLLLYNVDTSFHHKFLNIYKLETFKLVNIEGKGIILKYNTVHETA